MRAEQVVFRGMRGEQVVFRGMRGEQVVFRGMNRSLLKVHLLTSLLPSLYPFFYPSIILSIPPSFPLPSNPLMWVSLIHAERAVVGCEDERVREERCDDGSPGGSKDQRMEG